MRMRLTPNQSLQYLSGVGFPMAYATYYRIKAWLKKTQLERLHFIAAIGFEAQHLERIDTCELMAQLHWQNFHLEKSPYRKSMILREIRELQPYISTYYEATKGVIKPVGGQDTAGLSEHNTVSEPTPEWS